MLAAGKTLPKVADLQGHQNAVLAPKCGMSRRCTCDVFDRRSTKVLSKATRRDRKHEARGVLHPAVSVID